MRLLLLLALVALPANAEPFDDVEACQDALDDEFWPEWRSTYQTLVGCMNPAICGGVWNSVMFEVKRRPAGKKMTVWCRVEGDDITLSESNPYKVNEEEQFSAP